MCGFNEPEFDEEAAAVEPAVPAVPAAPTAEFVYSPNVAGARTSLPVYRRPRKNSAEHKPVSINLGSLIMSGIKVLPDQPSGRGNTETVPTDPIYGLLVCRRFC